MYDPTETTRHFGQRADDYRARAGDDRSEIARRIFEQLTETFEALSRLALAPAVTAKAQGETEAQAQAVPEAPAEAPPVQAEPVQAGPAQAAPVPPAPSPETRTAALQRPPALVAASKPRPPFRPKKGERLRMPPVARPPEEAVEKTGPAPGGRPRH
jgi:hypothetical protein